jgi:mono/diheme cytochrome c family protein
MLLSFNVFTGCKSKSKQPLVVNALDDTKIIDDYDTAYVGIPLSDTTMQHNKEAFVIYGCAYCHGIYLTPVGEATDLRKSTIVGADVNGNLIGKILRNGIPLTPKSSPMPQFSDLKDEEIQAISAYIHYARHIANKK